MKLVLLAITAFLDALLVDVLFNCFMESACSRRKRNAMLVAFGVYVVILNYIVGNVYLKFALCTAYVFLYALFCFSTDKTTKAFVSLFFSSIFLMGDAFVYGVMELLSMFITFTGNWRFAVGASISYIFLFAFMLILRRMKHRIYSNEQKSIRVLLICFPLMCALISDIFLEFLKPQYIKMPFYVYIIISLLFLLQNIGLVKLSQALAVSHEQVKASAVLRAQLRQYDAQIAASVKHAEIIRRYHHDIRHFKSVIARFINDEDIDSIKSFFTDVAAYAPELDAIHTGNRAADVIIQGALERAEKDGILLEIAANIPEMLPIADVHLCVVLANALENALEACAKVPQNLQNPQNPPNPHNQQNPQNPQNRTITLRIFMKGKCLIIEVSNPLAHVPEMQNGFPVTSKPDKEFHGQGIKNILSIAQNYGGHVKCTVDGGVFTIICILNLN